MHSRIGLLRPDFRKLLVAHKIFLAASAIDQINRAIIGTLVQHIIKHTAQGSKADTTGDKEQILALELILHREMIAIGPTHSNLLAHLHIKMEKIRNATTALDAELNIFFVSWRRGDGKNRLALTGHRQDGTLTGHMLEQLAPAQGLHSKGFDISRFLANISNHANHGN